MNVETTVRDIHVVVDLGGKQHPVSVAIDLAQRLGAHLTGVALAFQPIIPVYTMAAPKLDQDRKPDFGNIPPHSGLVTKASGGKATQVTSKWGSWHIYRHAPADVWSDYGIPTFLRSKRKGGHTARVV